jgi:hypothetical protein
MQHNPWKLTTIGLALMGTTALGTGLTTAWMMRPPAAATAQEATAIAPAPSTTVARMAPAAPGYAVTPAVQRTSAAPVARASTPVRPVSTAATAECGTNGDRVMRIAKPGLIGALLGAGAGAATGAIANGGKAAGKGALIGGLAGTAVGAGYGAYKTKNECGTVFNFSGNGSAPSYAGGSPAPQAALTDGQGITVYNVR